MYLVKRSLTFLEKYLLCLITFFKEKIVKELFRLANAFTFSSMKAYLKDHVKNDI